MSFDRLAKDDVLAKRWMDVIRRGNLPRDFLEKMVVWSARFGA